MNKFKPHSERLDNGSIVKLSLSIERYGEICIIPGLVSLGLTPFIAGMTANKVKALKRVYHALIIDKPMACFHGYHPSTSMESCHFVRMNRHLDNNQKDEL